MNAMDHFASTPQPPRVRGRARPDAVLRGLEPAIAGARLRLEGDAPRWSRDGVELMPGAGTGIAAGIVDLLLGEADAAAAGAAPASPGGEREREIPVDQTHTSVIVDERWVVKIVGAWGSADRSAAILERLRAAGSDVAPRFLGAVEWRHPERGSSALALVSAYVPDSDDGWTWAVDDVLAHLSGGADEPDWPARLGALTAGMHAVLREEFAEPDPRGGDRARAEAVADRAFALIGAEEDPAAPRPLGFARRMRARRSALAAAIASIPLASSAPLVTPHGDFHVGQILRTADRRYLVLDFDGDPQWGAEQRFRPDGAARDVAHMLVSIDLVAAVVQRRLGGPDERAWAWALAAQRAFLDAYRAQAGGAELDEAALPGLIAEQLLLELCYAERYLPAWRYAPDGVITRRYPRTLRAGRDTQDPENPQDTENTDETEPPWNPPASPTT